MQITTKLRDVRTALANRRTMRVAHRKLAGELASFRTTAERAELDQLLSRHSNEETEVIREILYRQDTVRLQTSGRQTAGMGGFVG
ncbi:hypothetical protein [Actinoplanes sp. M2I2]|uniref:hypothetical protein n=1 Tax=Actinoplanes sp. M2I2 TaxID=1734444 RepID=UPI002021707E|nr:hypothetical protein [Actinoplanes sp. M2I2]